MRRVAFPEPHPPECSWHHDWHACSCGALDARGYETMARRIADQLDTASAVLRQEPVTAGDLLRVQRQLEAEAALLKLVARRSSE